MRALFAFVCTVGLAACSGNSNKNDGGSDMAVPSDLSVALDLAPAGPCDPLAQTGCPMGQKCAIAIIGSGQNATLGPMCEADGTVALGGTCTRTMGTVDSDCQGGAFCARTGGLQLTCHKLCAKDGDCATEERCVGFTDNVGFCIPSCTPGGSGCGAGLDCSAPEPGVGSTQTTVKNPFWTCRAASADGGAPFAECMRSTDCAPAEVCDRQNGWCTPLCDLLNDKCPQPPNQDGGLGNPGVSCQAALPGLTPGACL